MYHIRFHGRGGQGIKTASRILGTAFFLEGFEVQDAPLYGAERRGAPIIAYVRASKETINERGIIRRPNLVIVVDESLISVLTAGVLVGASKQTVLLINSHEKPEIWTNRLNFPGLVLTLPKTEEVGDLTELPFIGSTCVGAAARLIGVISMDALKKAIHVELTPLGKTVIKENLVRALEAYNLMEDHAGCVKEGEKTMADTYENPDWVDIPFEDARISAPAIHASVTSEKIKTGLWRTMSPVIDYDICNKCWWICSTFCPDSAINLNDKGYPQIDYEHCKGCMICVAKCPRHAIDVVQDYKVQVDKTEGENP